MKKKVNSLDEPLTSKVREILENTPLRVRMKVSILASTMFLFKEEELTPEVKEKVHKWAEELSTHLVEIVKDTKPEMIQ